MFTNALKGQLNAARRITSGQKANAEKKSKFYSIENQ